MANAPARMPVKTFPEMVYLFDPHEDGMGCGTPKPPKLTVLLNSFDGHILLLADVVSEIQEVVPEGKIIPYGRSTLSFGPPTNFGYISVALNPMKNTGRYHDNYCAIKYHEVCVGDFDEDE